MSANIFAPASSSRLGEEYRLLDGVACQWGHHRTGEMHDETRCPTSNALNVDGLVARRSCRHAGRGDDDEQQARDKVEGEGYAAKPWSWRSSTSSYIRNYDDDFDRKAAGGGY